MARRDLVLERVGKDFSSSFRLCIPSMNSVLCETYIEHIADHYIIKRRSCMDPGIFGVAHTIEESEEEMYNFLKARAEKVVKKKGYVLEDKVEKECNK